MSRKVFIAALLAVTVVLLFIDWKQTNSTEFYPDHPINVIVHSSPGGGADLWARKISVLMEQELGKKMIVSNLAGGKGGVAANMVWNSPHDGYTILGGSETSLLYYVNGVFNKTAKDWDFMISGGSPGVIATLAGSGIESFEDFIGNTDQTKASPETKPMAISNSGKGKLWHLKALLIEEFSGINVIHTSYNGSNPAVVALLSGEVDAISCSAGEISAYVESGDVIPLVMTESYPYRFRGYGDVPAVTEFFPEMETYLPMAQILCLLIPGDLPPNVKWKLYAAFDAAVHSADMEEFLSSQNASIIGLYGEDAKELAVEMESKLSWFTYDRDISTNSPADAGIEKFSQ